MSPTSDRTVVLCADATYRVPLAVLVHSLATVHSSDPLSIVVLHDGFAPADVERITALAGAHAIRWIEPDAAGLASTRLPTHLPPAALFRLLAVDLLPAETGRFVYLDTDTVVCDGLGGLFELDLEGRAVGAVRDAWIEVAGSPKGPPASSLRMDPSAPYFNSGVLVVATDAWRAADVTGRSLALLREHRLPYADQCALNAVLEDGWLELAPRWNLQTAHGTTASHETDPARQVAVHEALVDPAVVHYVGAKPWQRADVVRSERWWELLAGTPYAGEVPRPGDADGPPSSDPRSVAAVLAPMRRVAGRSGKRLVRGTARRAGVEIRRAGAAAPALTVSSEVVELVLEQTRGVVADGPFAGMQLLTQASWGGHHDLVPKLLGTYEQELASVIDEIVERRPSRVVNVGCADGYYAVGMARLLPEAQVVGIDIVADSLRIAAEAAGANGVARRVTFLESLDELPSGGAEKGRGTAWLVDIEGAEEELLAPRWTDDLAGAFLVIECHDFVNPGVTGRLGRQFEVSHEIEVIRQAGRDPNRIPLLRDLDEAQRWLAMSEGRPRPMHWLVLRPRT